MCARTVVIVCPPSLSIKWQDEMREKFGLDFVIVNSELMADVRRTHGLDLHAQTFRNEILDRPADVAGDGFLAIDD